MSGWDLIAQDGYRVRWLSGQLGELESLSMLPGPLTASLAPSCLDIPAHHWPADNFSAPVALFHAEKDWNGGGWWC